MDVTVCSGYARDCERFRGSRVWRRIFLRWAASAKDIASKYRQGVRGLERSVEWKHAPYLQFIESKYKSEFERRRIYGRSAIGAGSRDTEWLDRHLRRRDDHGNGRIE